ncbi:MAG: hypothetical protein AAFU61_01435 [Pseudomonadota bacterium]
MLACLAFLLGAAHPVHAQMSRIGEEWRWRAIVVDRVIRQTDGDGWLRHSADGRVAGEVDGKAWAGEWAWYEDRVCLIGAAEGAAAREARCARAGIGRGRIRLYWNDGGGTEYALR